MIRNEIVSVDIDGVAKYPTTTQITLGIGKGYNTCTLSGINIDATTNTTLNIIINSIAYVFIVSEVNKGRDGTATIKGSGRPIILTDETTGDDVFTYPDSNTLVTLSANTIPVNNTLPNVLFISESYAKDSTPMSRIKDIVDLVGGEMYEVDGTLFLDEQKAISLSPIIAHTFLDSEVFDYSYSTNRDKTILLNKVLINPVTNDLYSTTSTTLDFDEGEARGELFFNPSLKLGYTYSITGLNSRPETQTVVTEKIGVTNETSIKTKGGIDSIIYITLDGIPLILDTDYFIYSGHNLIRFATPLQGEVEVSYSTISVVVFATKSATFTVQYQCSKISDYIELSVDNIVNSGDCYTEIVQPLTYEDGGSVLVSKGRDVSFVFNVKKGALNLVTHSTQVLASGGILTIKYLYDTVDLSTTDKGFLGNITSVSKEVIETLNSEIIYDEDLATWLIYLDKTILSINDVYWGTQVLSGYTYVDTGVVPYITFNAVDVGKVVDISVTVGLDEILIPAPLAGNVLRYLDVISCNGLATSEIVPSDRTLCNLPSTFFVDVASTLNLNIEDIFGATVTGDFGSLVINNFGKVEVTVVTQGIFTIDCTSIKETASIIIDSNGVI